VSTPLTALALVCGALAGCAPQPRSQSYFEDHPATAADVVASCRVGTVRGKECENALAADKQRRDRGRNTLYRERM
jgi:hypothetical protein